MTGPQANYTTNHRPASIALAVVCVLFLPCLSFREPHPPQPQATQPQANKLKAPGLWLRIAERTTAQEMIDRISSWYGQGFRYIVWNAPASRPPGVAVPFWQVFDAGTARNRFLAITSHITIAWPDITQAVYVGGLRDTSSEVSYERLLEQAQWFAANCGIDIIIMDDMSGNNHRRNTLLDWRQRLAKHCIELGTEPFARRLGTPCCDPDPDFYEVVQIEMQAHRDGTQGLRKQDELAQHNFSHPYDLSPMTDAMVIAMHSNIDELRRWHKQGVRLLARDDEAVNSIAAVLEATRDEQHR